MANVKNKIINGMKKCNVCREIKPVSEYYPYKKTIRGACKKCQCKQSYEITKKWSPERKKEAYKKDYLNPNRSKNNIKSAKKRMAIQKQLCVEYLGGKCFICGYNRCIQALEFHHKDPTIKEKIKNHAAIGRRKKFEDVKAELDKCLLLCANCHREFHYE